MKRDMDLVRAILLAYEADESPYHSDNVKDHGEQLITGHIQVMYDAGLLEPIYSPIPSRFPDRPIGSRMTWFGHDFLEAARDDTRWNQAKGIIAKIGGVTFEIMKQILTQVMADQVKQVMGINP